MSVQLNEIIRKFNRVTITIIKLQSSLECFYVHPFSLVSFSFQSTNDRCINDLDRYTFSIFLYFSFLLTISFSDGINVDDYNQLQR